MKKRILSILLALTLSLGLLPAAVLAEGIPAYGWQNQVPEDPNAITYDMEVADFGTMEYGYEKEDCPTLTISFTNTGNQTLWYIHDGSTKAENRFESSVSLKDWDSFTTGIRGFPSPSTPWS